MALFWRMSLLLSRIPELWTRLIFHYINWPIIHMPTAVKLDHMELWNRIMGTTRLKMKQVALQKKVIQLPIEFVICTHTVGWKAFPKQPRKPSLNQLVISSWVVGTPFVAPRMWNPHRK